ncbi:MCE family protein MceD [Nocardia nova SH22a]|uniref:MCE family protein MceD n=1 Tax=Nocardia nova SH22a TaxID=1415166 RepID=W5TEJ3_9NOCA|nr:MCE family protein [Nocardia nova]AHH17760.1 MCE family protein MceD [Nocardia nova SH22a]
MRPSAIVKLGLALLLGAIAGCSGGPAALTHRTHTVTAAFDSGAGLYVGNAVAVLGMPIGKVTHIDPRGTQVEVTMDLDASVPIPADATAVTVSTSVLTDRHVEFTPVYRGGPRLPDRARLGLDHTRTPVEFDKLLGVADRMSGQLQGDRPGDGPVAHLLDAAAATSANGPDMKTALDTLSRALRLGDDGGAETRNTLTEIVDQLSRLMGAAAQHDQEIRQFDGAARQMTDLLADLDLGTGTTGTQINDLVRQATELLTTDRPVIRSTVGDSAVLLRSLADYRDQLAEFIDLSPLLLDNAYAAVDFQHHGVRAHPLLEKIVFDSQLAKEVCNLLGMRQLGCATGTLQDFGPDFGIAGMLTGIARLPK